jgi:hypothetical protein
VFFDSFPGFALSDIVSLAATPRFPGPEPLFLSRRRAHYRLTTWLAFVALGLLMVCPTVSRTLVAMTPTPDLGAWCTGHGLDRAHGAPSMPAHPASDAACGYCVLLGHSPVLSSAFVAFVPAVPPASPTLAMPQLGAPYLRSLPIHLRGPPVA